MTATAEKQSEWIEIPDDAEELQTNAAPLVKFSVTDKSIAEAKARHAKLVALPKIPEDDLRRELTTLVTCRTTIDKERKFQNDAAQKHIKFVNSEANRVTAELAPLETDLQKRWDAVAAEKLRVKREREDAEKKAIQDKIDADNAARKAELDAEAERVKAMEAKLLEKQKELDRLEADRKAKADAEAAAVKAKADEQARLDRIAEEEARKARQKKEDEEREKQRQQDEADRKAAKAKQDAIDADQRAKQAELDRKQKEIEDAAAAVKAAKEKSDREEFQRQAKIKAAEEAKAKAEADRIAAEEAAVRETERLAELAKRAEAMKPDIEKARGYLERIRKANVGPILKDESVIDAVGDAMESIQAACATLSEWIDEQASIGSMPVKVIA